jgi:hypothetical protein
VHGEEVETIVIDERFCGPPGTGNGGYVAGRLARHLGGDVEVTLRRPAALGRPLRIVRTAGGVSLVDGETLVADAVAGALDVAPPSPVSLDEAREAGARFPRFNGHPLPRCFVCGPDRPESDGLRIFPGPTADGALYAAPWIPDRSLADDRGLVRSEFLWAALDCTGAFAVNEPSRGLVLLGRLAARIGGALPATEPAVVAGWPIADHGRRLIAGTAVFTAAGNLVAIARATWIFVTGPLAN